MNLKKSKIYKVIVALMFQVLLFTNKVLAITSKGGFDDYYYPRKRSIIERIVEFIGEHLEIIGVLIGFAIIIYYYIKLRKKLDESKNTKEYPSEENKNPVAKGLKETQKGYIVDYFFTFLIGLIIIILSLIVNVY